MGHSLVRRLAPFLIPLTAVAMSFAPAASARTSIPANIDVSRQVGNEAEDAISVNPTNPDNIVAMSVLPGPALGIFEGVTFDGGQTWTRQILGDGDELGIICCDQQLAWDGFGNLWMTYLESGSTNVPVALSTDGGLAFAKVADITPTKPKGGRSPKNPGSKGNDLHPKGTSSPDQPSISAGAGSVWVSYTSYPAVVVQASGAPVTGLGKFGSFTSPETVPTSRGRGNFGDSPKPP